jgi:DNA-binding MltR family transcriptional regulator
VEVRLIHRPSHQPESHTVEYQIKELPPRVNFLVMHESTQLDHRGLVLTGVADLEEIMANLLLAYFRKADPSLTSSIEDVDIFRENRALGSLSKMLHIAPLLGLVTNEELYDLGRLVRLRNMYAHGKNRKQFHYDAETLNVLRSLKLYAASANALAKEQDQFVFIEMKEFLANRLTSRAKMIDTLPAFQSFLSKERDLA